MRKTMIVLGCLCLGLTHAQQGRTHAQHTGATKRVGINTEKPVASFEISKANGVPATQVQGLLLPHLSQKERNAMQKEALTNGLMIFNTNKNCIEWWDGSNWKCIDGKFKDEHNSPWAEDPILPSGLKIIGGQHVIASIYDNDYLPYSASTGVAIWPGTVADHVGGGTDPVINVPAKITTAGVTVKVLITYTGAGTTTLNAYTSNEIAIDPNGDEDAKGTSTKKLVLSWDEQQVTSDTKYITAKLKAVGGDLNVRKLDINTGVGQDGLGLLLAKFRIPESNDTNAPLVDYAVRVISGIPDKKFNTQVGGQYRHRFLYLPVIGPDGKHWLNNNLGAEYADVNDPRGNFNPVRQAEKFDDYKAYGSLFQWGRDSDGHELVNWSISGIGTWVYPIAGWVASEQLFYTAEKDPCPDGWRTPTYVEFEKLRDMVNNGYDLQHKGLKFPMNNLRSWNGGENFLYYHEGTLWTSTDLSTDKGYEVIITTENLNIRQVDRGVASGIRCIKD